MDKTYRRGVLLAVTALLAIMAIIISFLVSMQDDANAQARRGQCSWYLGCGTVDHYAPDDGYDPPIIITCDWGAKPQTWLYEGQRGNTSCAGYNGDVDGFYLRAGEQAWCFFSIRGVYNWYPRGARGWNKVYDGENWLCTLRVS